MTLFADLELARRVEALAAEEMRRFVATAREIDPACGAEALEIAGGAASYVAPGSPLNQAIGLGLGGPVPEHHIEEIEWFFRSRGAQPALALCPLAHPTLAESLAHRGWVTESFENVLVRPLDVPVANTPGDIVIVEAQGEEERDLWALVAATAFSAPLDPPAEQLVLCSLVSLRPRTRLYLAFLEGRPAGTGELFVEDGVGWLSADATLPQFRGRGVQTALQGRRMTDAREAGCALAVSEAAPGSVSQRNMHRHGFQVAYTRSNLVAEPDNLNERGTR